MRKMYQRDGRKGERIMKGNEGREGSKERKDGRLKRKNLEG